MFVHFAANKGEECRYIRDEWSRLRDYGHCSLLMKTSHALGCWCGGRRGREGTEKGSRRIYEAGETATGNEHVCFSSIISPPSIVVD